MAVVTCEDHRDVSYLELHKIGDVVSSVDLKEKVAETGKEFSEEGTVFTLFEDILTDISEKMSADENEDGESVLQALEAISSLGDADEGEWESLLATALLGIAPDETDEDLEEGTSPEDLEIANSVVRFVFETAKEKLCLTLSEITFMRIRK